MGKPITEQYHAVEKEIKLDRMIEFEIAQIESNVICYWWTTENTILV